MALGVPILKHFRVSTIIFFEIREYFEISVFVISRIDCIRSV